MKNILFYSIKQSKIILIVLIILIVSSCQKDNEIVLEGSLKVQFFSFTQNLSKDILPAIYTTESTEPLLENLKEDSNHVIKVDNLNYGNYYFVYYLTNGGKNVKLFQVNPGKTTSLDIIIH